MSGPVPSPSMNGMMGSSGTWRRPSRMAIVSPRVGGCRSRYAGRVEAVMGRNLAAPNARINRAAAAIADAYERWQTHFQEVTRRAPAHFECRDWHGAQTDATERLHLYK